MNDECKVPCRLRVWTKISVQNQSKEGSVPVLSQCVSKRDAESLAFYPCAEVEPTGSPGYKSMNYRNWSLFQFDCDTAEDYLQLWNSCRKRVNFLESCICLDTSLSGGFKMILWNFWHYSTDQNLDVIDIDFSVLFKVAWSQDQN